VGRVGTNVVYAPYIEFGRRPGQRMPPPAALQGWAQRHGIKGENAGFLVARAIGRHGLKARHVLENAARAKASDVVKRIADAVGDLIRRL